MFPCLKILPSCCSMSAGRQGMSRWCRATSLSWTFVPAPIFCVEPNKKRTCPLLTLPNSSAFFVSVSAVCINAISFPGTPFEISFCFISSYTLNSPLFFGVEASQNINCADFCPFVCSHMANALSVQALVLELLSSGSRLFTSLWSNASFLPSFVMLNILSCDGSTSLLRTASARSASDCTISFW